MADRKKLIAKRFTAIEARKMILSMRSDISGTDGSCSDDSETEYIQTLVESSDDESCVEDSSTDDDESDVEQQQTDDESSPESDNDVLYSLAEPAKYGIKLWALCDSSTSFALNMQVYLGKREGEPPEKNKGERVVRD